MNAADLMQVVCMEAWFSPFSNKQVRRIAESFIIQKVLDDNKETLLPQHGSKYSFHEASLELNKKVSSVLREFVMEKLSKSKLGEALVNPDGTFSFQLNEDGQKLVPNFIKELL